MVKKSDIKKWNEGIYTDYGLYTLCETDEEFYNILKNNGESEESIKKTMNNVSGADDAYNDVKSQQEIRVKVQVGLSGIVEQEVEIELSYIGAELDDIDDDEELVCHIEEDFEEEVLNNLNIEWISWERI